MYCLYSAYTITKSSQSSGEVTKNSLFLPGSFRYCKIQKVFLFMGVGKTVAILQHFHRFRPAAIITTRSQRRKKSPTDPLDIPGREVGSFLGGVGGWRYGGG